MITMTYAEDKKEEDKKTTVSSYKEAREKILKWSEDPGVSIEPGEFQRISRINQLVIFPLEMRDLRITIPTKWLLAIFKKIKVDWKEVVEEGDRWVAPSQRVGEELKSRFEFAEEQILQAKKTRDIRSNISTLRNL